MSTIRAIWQASLTATKRALTWNIDDLIPPSERFIYHFNSKQELNKWHLYSDSEYGGLSSAALEITDAGKEQSGTGVFSGNLSLDVTEGTKWNISRSGFCGMRSKKFDGFIDLDPYDTIALRIKGDGRSYISTIYTENWVNSPGQMEDNSWQAFVAVPKDNWVVAKKWHPDRCSDSKHVEEAKNKFQAIQEAYSVLSNVNKRFLYDVGVYDSDDDDKDGMADFMSEMAVLMSQNKPNGNGESFEELKDLFEELFDESENLTSDSFSSFGESSSSSSTPSNKRGSSVMSTEDPSCFQGFSLGAGGRYEVRNNGNNRRKGRRA